MRFKVVIRLIVFVIWRKW